MPNRLLIIYGKTFLIIGLSNISTRFLIVSNTFGTMYIDLGLTSFASVTNSFILEPINVLLSNFLLHSIYLIISYFEILKKID